MTRQPCVLAIDLGTSGPKVAVVGIDGGVLGWARTSVDTLRLAGGGAEQDVRAVWDAVVNACTQALASPSVLRDNVRAVICASQYSSIVPVDSSGEPVANMIIWQDMRGTKSRLKQLPGFPRRPDTPFDLLRWLRIHGLPPVADGLSLNHVRFVKYGQPDIYARTAVFLEPMDYITLRLTGRACANQCTALMFLVTDNRRLGATDYDRRLVGASLIDPDRLPELVPLDSVVGVLLPDVADRLGLSPTTEVVTGVNDTQAGAIGAGGFIGEHAVISIGSTCVLTTHMTAKHTDVRHAILSVPSPVPDTYFVMAENGLAGAALEHFLRNVVHRSDGFGDAPPADPFERLDAVAGGVPPGSGGLLFLPWIGGAMAPAEDGRMRGGFLNLSRTTTRADMTRAVLEGIALNLRWLRRPVERMVKRSFTHFLCYGGGAQSDLWCQIMADVLARPVHQLEDPQLTVCGGAAVLAARAVGLADLDQAAARVRVRRVYEPDPRATEVYDHLAPQFVKSYSATRRIVHAINRDRTAPPADTG